MLTLHKRWRIAKSIESGTPMPRSLTKAMEKSAELRAYSESMQRVQDGLQSTPEPTAHPDFVARIMNEIELTPQERTIEADPSADDTALAPFRFPRPLGIAAGLALLASITVVTMRPWASSPDIRVTGEFTTLVSLFQPIDSASVVAWMDKSLSDEAQAIAQDAQDIANTVLWGLQGSGLIGRDQGDGAGDGAGNAAGGEPE